MTFNHYIPDDISPSHEVGSNAATASINTDVAVRSLAGTMGFLLTSESGGSLAEGDDAGSDSGSENDKTRTSSEYLLAFIRPACDGTLGKVA
jgi:hypothetical protein